MNWIGDDKFAAIKAVIYTRAIVPSVLHPATHDIVSQPPPKSREETEDTEAQKFLPPGVRCSSTFHRRISDPYLC